MTHAPRPHQERAVAMLRGACSDGLRHIMLQMPTGAGKTFVAALIILSALEKDKRVLFIVDAISLVDQTVRALYGAGVYGIGVIQADHPMTDASKRVQVASVQTLKNRQLPNADIVIVDEAHRVHQWLVEMMRGDWREKPVIGLSATPWAKGLGRIYQKLLIPITMRQLIEQGYLSRFRVYAAAHPDLTGVKVQSGDYVTSQLSDAMSEGSLVADIVTTYQRLGESRPALVFCVDRAHAAKVQARFEMAGIGCGYIDHKTPRSERERIKDQLDRGEISAVANVACLTTGVDWAIGCIILARPTRSEILYVQMVGRGLRVNPGMDDCIILDHADNTLRMGFVTDIERTALCMAERGERQQAQPPVALPKECPQCSFLKPAKVRECPRCGYVPQRISDVEEMPGQLVRVGSKPPKPTMLEKRSWHGQLNTVARERGYKPGWVANRYRKRFGVWPSGFGLHEHLPVTDEVRRWVRHCDIAFIKGKQAA